MEILCIYRAFNSKRNIKILATELIDVVDTIVKIGLGSAITAVATHFSSKSAHAAEQRKLFLIRKLDALEKITDHFDQYTSTLSHLIAAIDGVRRRRPTTPCTLNLSIPLDNESYKFIHNADATFLASRQQLIYAVSKLSLLGFESTAKTANRLTSVSIDIRSLVIFSHTIPDEVQLDKWRKLLSDIKTEFYEDLSDHFNPGHSE